MADFSVAYGDGTSAVPQSRASITEQPRTGEREVIGQNLALRAGKWLTVSASAGSDLTGCRRANEPENGAESGRFDLWIIVPTVVDGALDRICLVSED